MQSHKVCDAQTELDSRHLAAIDTQTARSIKGLVLTYLIIFCSVLAYYGYKFKELSVVADPELWGQFGDFIGGTLNPIAGIVSVAILYKTMSYQSCQLRIAFSALKQERDAYARTLEEGRLLDIIRIWREKAQSTTARDVDGAPLVGERAFDVIRRNWLERPQETPELKILEQHPSLSPALDALKLAVTLLDASRLVEHQHFERLLVTNSYPSELWVYGIQAIQEPQWKEHLQKLFNSELYLHSLATYDGDLATNFATKKP